MKLIQVEATMDNIQEFLDKYQDKIKFILSYSDHHADSTRGGKLILIVDVEGD